MYKILNFLNKKNIEIIAGILIFIFFLQENINFYFEYYLGLKNNPSIISFFTHSFLHANFTHILLNLIALFSLKDLLKKDSFFDLLNNILFISGVSGSLFLVLNNALGNSSFLLLGFSGVIFGLLGYKILDFYFSKEDISINFKLIGIIIFLNIFIIPFLIPSIS